MLTQDFRPGTIDEMGFGYEALKALNFRRHQCAMCRPYGQFSACGNSDQIGYDPIGQTRHREWARKACRPFAQALRRPREDGSLHSAIGTLAALCDYAGVGQTINVCLADSGYSLTFR